MRTATSNGAFGYNFEGALAEYVLMDKRIITSPKGESMLLPVGEELSGSAVALVEPWACVEDAYASTERTSLKKDGHMLVVADAEVPKNIFDDLFSHYGKPAQITWVSKHPAPAELPIPFEKVENVAELTDAGYDDVIYFGSAPETIETLFLKVALKGLLNIVLCGVFLTGKLKNGSTGMKDAVPGSILNAIPGITNMTDGSGERRMAEPDLAGFNYPEQKADQEAEMYK